jgi:ATP-dependent Lon protease
MIVLRKILDIQNMHNAHEEKQRHVLWVDTFMKIPFGMYKNVECENNTLYLQQCKTILDTHIYGLNDAKQNILQIVGKYFSNIDSNEQTGEIIGVEGKSGTGKSLLIEHMGKILNKPVHSVPLTCISNSSYLNGSDSVYIGSKCGRLVQILIDARTMNPIICLEHIDKINPMSSNDILSALYYLLDPTYLSKFQDQYLQGIQIDMSKCTFILTYEDKKAVDPVLLAKMNTKIVLKKYSEKERVQICKQFIYPKVCKQFGINSSDICLSDTNITYILNKYVQKEDEGLHTLRHYLHELVSKLNLKLLNGEISLPYEINEKIISTTITEEERKTYLSMYE